MENTATILVGLSKISKGIKEEYYVNKKVFRTNLFIWAVAHQYIGYKVFFSKDVFNFLDYNLGIVFCVIYYLSSLLNIEIVLIEFGYRKRADFNKSNFNKRIAVWFPAKEKNNSLDIKLKEFKEEAFTLIKPLEDEIKTYPNLIFSNQKSINKLNDSVFKKESLKMLNGFSQNNLKAIIKEYEKDLFKNIDMNIFFDFAFNKDIRKQYSELSSEELGRFIELLKIFQKNKLIDKNKAKLARIIILFFNINKKEDSVYRDIKSTTFKFMNHNTVKHVELEIRDLKNKIN